MKANKLEKLISQYIDGEIGIDEIEDYCFSLEPSLQNKEMLTECIICYDIDILYEALFSIFGGVMTEEEKQNYKNRFEKLFDGALYSDDIFE